LHRCNDVDGKHEEESMLIPSPYEAELRAKERTRDAIRAAERARMLPTVERKPATRRGRPALIARLIDGTLSLLAPAAGKARSRRAPAARNPR
jgi:hypothetical protein